MKQNVAEAEATVALAQLLSRQTRPGKVPRMCLAGPKHLAELSLSEGVLCAPLPSHAAQLQWVLVALAQPVLPSLNK
jgi:hypothetical protein